MSHPNGGQGNQFPTNPSFENAFRLVGENGIQFLSTTGEQITANQAFAQDYITPVIVFVGERNRHGSVCSACWGFRQDCNGSYIGQCVEPLNEILA